jgi:hypothetical protein
MKELESVQVKKIGPSKSNSTIQFTWVQAGAYWSSDFGGFYGTELGGHWDLERHEAGGLGFKDTKGACQNTCDCRSTIFVLDATFDWVSGGLVSRY